MTRPPRIDDGRKRVWIAFADHFLDTETRYALPMAAYAAVEAGFGAGEAKEIWCYEVTPVVGANLWSVAGEWAGWDEVWLVDAISGIARRRTRAPGPLAYLAYRATIHFGHASWTAIERLMEALLSVEPAARKALASDLEALGRCYFDFAPGGLRLDRPGRREALRVLFSDVFLPALQPTVFRSARESPEGNARRVEEALR
jgi:hypothetical protein